MSMYMYIYIYILLCIVNVVNASQPASSDSCWIRWSWLATTTVNNLRTVRKQRLQKYGVVSLFQIWMPSWFPYPDSCRAPGLSSGIFETGQQHWHQTRVSSHFNIQSQRFQCILKWTSPWIEFRMEITRIYHWSLWQGPLTFHSTNSRESKKPLTSQQFTTTEYKDKSQQFVSCYATTFWPKNGRLNCLFRGSC